MLPALSCSPLLPPHLTTPSLLPLLLFLLLLLLPALALARCRHNICSSSLHRLAAQPPQPPPPEHQLDCYILVVPKGPRDRERGAGGEGEGGAEAGGNGLSCYCEEGEAHPEPFDACKKSKKLSTIPPITIDSYNITDCDNNIQSYNILRESIFHSYSNIIFSGSEVNMSLKARRKGTSLSLLCRSTHNLALETFWTRESSR
ncbi:hypothetical protein GUITHDRAFT_147182 [Guillardia theta CCMP2712]|uniref:Ig-like domain-containing protein n=1 Tax=Guillardia theta (strain CCMP2712) TaxID=905079 RepID=L1IE27_GUITC|nr:hypothetical protein GUITHDRAFT_147182 [Guillardia theta CCMP2712]EKX34483.1 hypothetical protein GUITHDRAFT_147182 [Guillardia theta CCMP2712]|eukprot:XP_005821463.1 hypothetical protein GUITHDRAFT_147182 [Guillardia theta CCMP2712]